MAFDDITLNRPSAPEPAPTPAPPPDPPSRARVLVVIIAAVIAGAALTFWWMSRAEPSTARPAPTTATDVAIGANRPKREPIDLPSLDESDSLLSGLIGALSRNPTIARLLLTKGLVRMATLTVVQIGNGRTPAEPLKTLRPATRLDVLGTVTGYIDPKTYTRWEPSVSALTSVSASDAAQLYVNVKPLFDRAYIELGNTGGDFDAAIVRALQMLDETPTLAKEPMLLRRPGYFEHSDETLKALSPVQKQLLLIGPDNRRKVMTWLHDLASRLDLRVQ